MTEYELGTAIKFATTFADAEGTATDADTMVIEIVYASTKAVGVTAVSMTRDDVGEYSYTWQTTENDDTGQYEVEATATINGVTAKDRDLVDLVRIKETD